MKSKSIVFVALLVLCVAQLALAQSTINPKSTPKFVNQLVIPPVYEPINITDDSGNLLRQDYTITMQEFNQQILPEGYPMTQVWGYGGMARVAITGQDLGFIQHSPAPGTVPGSEQTTVPSK